MTKKHNSQKNVNKVTYNPIRKSKDHVAENIMNVSEEIFGVNPLSTGFKVTENNYHRGYDFNMRRNSQSRVRWDCSEMSSALMLETVKSMQTHKNTKWNTNFKEINSAFAVGSSSQYQENKLKEYRVPMISNNKNTIKSKLEPGMVIFMDYPTTKSGYSRHVVTVTRDQKTGGLLIAEAIGGKNNIGVVHRSVDSFFNTGKAANAKTKWSSYDPFYKDRTLLNKLDNYNSIGRELYKTAESNYKNIIKTSSSKSNKDEYIKNFIKSNLSNGVNSTFGLTYANNKSSVSNNLLKVNNKLSNQQQKSGSVFERHLNSTNEIIKRTISNEIGNKKPVHQQFSLQTPKQNENKSEFTLAKLNEKIKKGLNQDNETVASKFMDIFKNV